MWIGTVLPAGIYYKGRRVRNVSFGEAADIRGKTCIFRAAARMYC